LFEVSPFTIHDSPFTLSGLWTVIPVRGIASGKSRLAGVMTAAERALLNRWLLAHTLGMVGEWRGDLSRCVVVSSCREALELAARHGAVTVDEGQDATGHNAAAALGAAYARRQGACGVLVLACDLPYLTADALAEMARAAGTSRAMVIAPDRRGTGTNALLVRVEGPFEFRFGEGSYAGHLELAAERGWKTFVCSRPELAFDLDTPEDFALWQASRSGERKTSDIVPRHQIEKNEEKTP
jgi:2-phospho-L-lactate guanylyltransferase